MKTFNCSWDFVPSYKNTAICLACKQCDIGDLLRDEDSKTRPARQRKYCFSPYLESYSYR